MSPESVILWGMLLDGRFPGVLFAFVTCLGAAGFALFGLRKWLADLDPSAQFGLAGLCGLGILGTPTYFVGLLPGALGFWVYAPAILLLVGLPHLGVAWKGTRPGLPAVLLLVFLVLGLIGVCAPSTAADWDSVAYHLAIPKLWAMANQVQEVSFVHHSNFPFAVDGLFLLGMKFGGQAAAKFFVLALSGFGLFALFGLARARWGAVAALWAAVAFAATPVVLWESGTAYIDVAHGLFAGLGAWLLLSADRRPLVAGILLGLAMGSKYTGLPTAFLVFAIAPFVSRVSAPHPQPLPAEQGGEIALKEFILAGVLSLLIGGVWYGKNAVTVGNPVYPFFYEQLGGKNWSQLQADVYKNEQKTFGVPGAANLPHAILGTAYQPGRYTNPSPKLNTDGPQPTGGTGSPLAAVGFLLLAAGLGAAAFRLERPILLWVFLNLVLWCFLSQQSRYLLSFAPVLALCLGALVARKDPVAKIMMGATVLQALASLVVLKDLWLTDDKLHVAFAPTQEPYLERALPTFRLNGALKNETGAVKVALYDEVFGLYLDVPYYWASFGHSTQMGYETMQSAEDLLAAYRRLGFTHVYLNLRFLPQEEAVEFAASCGLAPGPEGWQSVPVTPLPEEKFRAWASDPQQRWRPFFSELAASGQVSFVSGSGASLLFRLRD